MIDASKGFIKDGPKNRLRSQDIHKIVDVFNKQTEIERYSRMVPLARSPIRRTTTTSTSRATSTPPSPRTSRTSTRTCTAASPTATSTRSAAYWDAFPQLRSQLFKPNRPGYSDLAVDVSDVQQAILDSTEFQKFADEVASLVADWFAAHRDDARSDRRRHQPERPDRRASATTCSRASSRSPLLDEYDVYEQLMTYWHEHHARRRLPDHERRLGRRRQAAQDHRGQGPQARRDARPGDRLRPKRDQVQDGPDPARV